MTGSELLTGRQPAAPSEVRGWFGKYLAFLTLVRMIRWLANWREVWQAYKSRSPLPPLRFRRGFVLHHGELDDPVMLFQEVFARGAYSRQLFRPVASGTVIDLGANIGMASLMWTTRHPRIRVHAYEPNPPTLQTLRQNIHDNGLDNQVTIHHEAVGREPGCLRFWSNVPSIQATGYGETPPNPEGIEITVPMIDLDEVMSRVPQGMIELLKMDIEGAEAEVLEAASDSSLKRIKQVVLEYHGGLFPGAQVRCSEVLGRAGFRLRISPADPINGLLYACRE